MWHILSPVARKPIFRVRHKLGCTVKEDGLRLEILDFRRRGIVLSKSHKTLALISCAVSAQLICAFGFAYAKSRFSHDMANYKFFMN